MYPSISINRKEFQSTILKRFESLIDQHRSNPAFGIKDYSESLHLDRTQLFRKVKKDTTLSPSEFIRRRKMNYATRLLVGTDMSIFQIMLACGYSSNSSFTKAFKQVYHIAPSCYRKSLVGNN